MKIFGEAENCELSPKENYLLAFHPHGVLSLSAICTFGANQDDYRDIFPGMNSYLCTLPVWFRVPFFREMLMVRIIQYIVNQGSAGRAKRSAVYEWHTNNPYYSFRTNSIKPRKYSIYVK